MARRGHVGPAQRGPWRPHSLPGYYAGGVTAESSWDEILKARGVQPQWPQLGFGNAMVPISNVCLSKDDDTLAIADRRSDNGVRLSADEFREQARVAMAKGPVTRRDQLARLAGSVPGGASALGAGLIRYPVSVYRALPNNKGPVIVFLFEKPWKLATCSAR